MNPSKIQDELIAQHRDLRARIDEARLASLRWARGDVSRSHVRGALAELADALQAHHAHEESALRELIGSIDARRAARAALMDDEHVQEHHEMLDALTRVGNTAAAADAGRELENFCSRVLAHMTWEEKALLNASVPRDDGEDS